MTPDQVTMWVSIALLVIALITGWKQIKEFLIGIDTALVEFFQAQVAAKISNILLISLLITAALYIGFTLGADMYFRYFPHSPFGLFCDELNAAAGFGFMVAGISQIVRILRGEYILVIVEAQDRLEEAIAKNEKVGWIRLGNRVRRTEGGAISVLMFRPHDWRITFRP